MFSLEARYTARAVVFGALTALLVAYALAGAACAPTTRVVAAWKDPLVGDVVVQRPLVVFQHPSEALRRSVEDALVQRIPGAVPAYRLIGTEQIFDVLGIQQQVQQAGFDTVIVAGVDER